MAQNRKHRLSRGVDRLLIEVEPGAGLDRHRRDPLEIHDCPRQASVEVKVGVLRIAVFAQDRQTGGHCQLVGLFFQLLSGTLSKVDGPIHNGVGDRQWRVCMQVDEEVRSVPHQIVPDDPSMAIGGSSFGIPRKEAVEVSPIGWNGPCHARESHWIEGGVKQDTAFEEFAIELIRERMHDSDACDLVTMHVGCNHDAGTRACGGDGDHWKLPRRAACRRGYEQGVQALRH